VFDYGKCTIEYSNFCKSYFVGCGRGVSDSNVPLSQPVLELQVLLKIFKDILSFYYYRIL